jgi:hypothetical protein
MPARICSGASSNRSDSQTVHPQEIPLLGIYRKKGVQKERGARRKGCKKKGGVKKKRGVKKGGVKKKGATVLEVSDH